MTEDMYSEEFQKNARVSKWYDRITSELDKCPFCDLKEKYIIAEKDDVVLTVNLFPYIDGQLLIIPRRHIKYFNEINQKEWKATKYLINWGIRMINEELCIDNTNTLYREGSSSGVSLEHLHFHVLPITPEFMQYEKTHFIWKFQKINYPPIEMANRLREYYKKHAEK